MENLSVAYQHRVSPLNEQELEYKHSNSYAHSNKVFQNDLSS